MLTRKRIHVLLNVRWLHAEPGWTSDAKNKMTALESHLQRMKELQLRTEKMYKSGLVSLLDATATEFYRAEAELWLAREQSKH